MATDVQGQRVRRHWDRQRLAKGAGWGMVATLAMSAFMLAGVAAGVSPMPKPIPAALVAHTLGPLPRPLVLGLAAIAHLGYGAAAGALVAGALRQVTLRVGMAYGLLLWMLMGLIWLPYLGWGFFGTGITARIALATLLLHVVYGTTLGLLLDGSVGSSPDGGR